LTKNTKVTVNEFVTVKSLLSVAVTLILNVPIGEFLS